MTSPDRRHIFSRNHCWVTPSSWRRVQILACLALRHILQSVKSISKDSSVVFRQVFRFRNFWWLHCSRIKSQVPFVIIRHYFFLDFFLGHNPLVKLSSQVSLKHIFNFVAREESDDDHVLRCRNECVLRSIIKASQAHLDDLKRKVFFSLYSSMNDVQESEKTINQRVILFIMEWGSIFDPFSKLRSELSWDLGGKSTKSRAQIQ